MTSGQDTSAAGPPQGASRAPSGGVGAHATDWTPVCRLDDILPNTGVCARVDGRQVAIFRLEDDSLYALDNYDPFSRVNVLSRGIVGDVKGELVVASPIYKQHFSLATGQCLEEAAVCITAYPVRLEGGCVLVGASLRNERLPAATKA